MDPHWLISGKEQLPKPTSLEEREETLVKNQKTDVENGGKRVIKVVMFYEDGTFDAYSPS